MGRPDCTKSVCVCDGIGCYDGSFYVLNRRHGDIHWCFQVSNGEPVKSSPAVDPTTGWVWFGSHDRHLYCLDILVSVGVAMFSCLHMGCGHVLVPSHVLARIRWWCSDYTLGEGHASLLLASPMATEFCTLQLWVGLWLPLTW